MKTFINKPENFSRIEFWAATTIFIFLIFFHITHALNLNLPPDNSIETANPLFNFFFVSRLIKYTVFYGAFLLLNFVLVPKLVQRESVFLTIVSIILVFAIIGTVFGFTNTYLQYLFKGAPTNPSTTQYIFHSSFLFSFWLMLLFGFYTVIKYASIYLLQRSKDLQAKYRFIAPGSIAVFVLWMITMFIILASDAPRPMAAIWAVIIPCSLLYYSFSFYYLLPKAMEKRKPFRFYLLTTIGILFLTYLPVFLLAFLFSQDEDPGAAISLFNQVFQLVIIMPLSWVLYKRHLRGNEEVYALKTELGRSHASFDFLRSQINPHFLFNALNTIYGTAIQEKAERTSEGIEKLGDMMRFMLQENMQDKISLARELEYLNNYISLQRLRTDTSPTVKIDAELDDRVNNIQIAPMLLIPFVENAFKHGISLRQPSYIRITLEIKDKTIYFDVNNSKHERQDNDPEKNKSGIGLENVRQRLQLLYPKRHELIIRETKKDFFIHLTLQLN